MSAQTAPAARGGLIVNKPMFGSGITDPGAVRKLEKGTGGDGRPLDLHDIVPGLSAERDELYSMLGKEFTRDNPKGIVEKEEETKEVEVKDPPKKRTRRRASTPKPKEPEDIGLCTIMNDSFEYTFPYKDVSEVEHSFMFVIDPDAFKVIPKGDPRFVLKYDGVEEHVIFIGGTILFKKYNINLLIFIKNPDKEPEVVHDKESSDNGGDSTSERE